MLAFVQQILAFATVEVLEPNWRKLEAKLGKECMLTSSKLLRARPAEDGYSRHTPDALRESPTDLMLFPHLSELEL
ncbi:6528_t:CDS:2 [Acaulospora colombiana]|uniref:6528_t:CDS:1 n=1 Tax=Acaulospora colombiana TaxID=27376 RepID=A0ACA9QAP4_9GLOM|nr:6528_t:CDS:2 [Acaulospora colombiana]